ncbi:Adenylate kinase [Metarhizium rileyi]|uniref:Adenylate kinase n=1 Tax=Metarhizium rileyi (strain RCEF 4871) TaxID=1649241 RepID=A0A166XM27_METRR|nr:Adenylate kinase [Metarhizium rileyi RCEF 4871]
MSNSLPASQQSAAQSPNPLETTPTVIRVLGGPGSGKRVPCRIAALSVMMEPICVGDILREEANRKGPHSSELMRHMLTCTVVPSEAIIPVVKSRMDRAARNGRKTIVLDGFPRNEDQLRHFESTVAPLKCLVLVHCTDRTAIRRCLPPERFDDDVHVFLGRRRAFDKEVSDLRDIFFQRGSLKLINGEQDVDRLCERMQAVFVGVAENFVKADEYTICEPMFLIFGGRGSVCTGTSAKRRQVIVMASQ